MRHWLAHLLGVNKCTVYTWWEGNCFYVAYRCVTCNKVQLIFKTKVRL